MAEDVEIRSRTSLTVFSKHRNAITDTGINGGNETVMVTVNKYLCRCDVRHVVVNIDLS